MTKGNKETWSGEHNGIEAIVKIDWEKREYTAHIGEKVSEEKVDPKMGMVEHNAKDWVERSTSPLVGDWEKKENDMAEERKEDYQRGLKAGKAEVVRELREAIKNNFTANGAAFVDLTPLDPPPPQRLTKRAYATLLSLLDSLVDRTEV